MGYIHEEYRQLVQKYKRENEYSILKTDAFQEANNVFPIDADYYLEINEGTVERARNAKFNAVQGDIRNIPFKDGEFSLLIDTSTIDHITNFGEVLKEYRRVLNSNGRIVLTVWLTNLPITKIGQDVGQDKQFYFSYDEFKAKFLEYFDIVDEGEFEDFKRGKLQDAVFVRYFVGDVK